MRKNLVIVTILIILSPLIFTGCNDQKDQELGKIKEQVQTLRLENSKLKKIIAKNEVNSAGNRYTGLGLGAVIIMTSGLIVWVINRRKQDGEET